MSELDKSVFISYRRDVSSFIARAIFMDLRQHGYDIFMDVENIDSGEFDTILLNQIEARAHFLIILTPGTVERFTEPNDWMRREIEHALTLRRNIVPLLVNGFNFKSVEPYLSGNLLRLTRLNALEVPHSYFDAAMERLRLRFLKQPVYGKVASISSAEATLIERKIAVVANTPRPTDQQLSAEQYFTNALSLQNTGNNEQAIAQYTEALRLNPSFAAAYYNRAIIFHDTGEFNAAIEDYSAVIRLKPKAVAYYNRGISYYDKGDYENAIADFDEAIRLTPNYEAAYYNRGNALLSLGKFDEAIRNYTETLKLNSQSLNGWFNRSIARKANGDVDGAAADYQEYIRLGGTFRFSAH
jgi:tetratricopeptide (TPR) repeat protein